MIVCVRVADPVDSGVVAVCAHSRRGGGCASPGRRPGPARPGCRYVSSGSADAHRAL